MGRVGLRAISAWWSVRPSERTVGWGEVPGVLEGPDWPGSPSPHRSVHFGHDLSDSDPDRFSEMTESEHQTNFQMSHRQDPI